MAAAISSIEPASAVSGAAFACASRLAGHTSATTPNSMTRLNNLRIGRDPVLC